MIVAACPKCHDKVTIPGGVHPAATVQCPLCSEQFSLTEIVERLPPRLIVIDSPATPPSASSSSIFTETPEPSSLESFDLNLAQQSAAAGAATAVADDDGELELAGAESAPAFAFDEAPAPSRPTAAPKKLAARPRPKKKPVNPAVEGVKIIGGGVLGVGIAIILLWWLPGRYGQDILGIGPNVSRFAPWIVPAKFHGSGQIGENNAQGGANDDDGPQLVVRDSNGQRRSLSDFGPLPGELEDNPVGGASSDSGGIFTAPTEPADPTAIAVPPVDFSALEPDPLEPVDPAPSVPRGPGGRPLGPRQATATSVAEVAETLDAVAAADEAYRGIEPSDRAAVIAGGRALYDAYRQFARSITFASQDDPSIGPQIERLRAVAGPLRANPKERQRLAYFAKEHLDGSLMSGDGVALVVKIKAIANEGRLFRTDVEFQPPSGDPVSFAMLSPQSGADADASFQPGAEVLLFGVLIENPRDNINGYTGDAARAIWGGYFLPLPPASGT